MGTRKTMLSQVGVMICCDVDRMNQRISSILMSLDSFARNAAVRCRLTLEAYFSPPEPLLHLANPPTWLLLAFLYPPPETIFIPLFYRRLRSLRFPYRNSKLSVLSLFMAILPLSATTPFPFYCCS